MEGRGLVAELASRINASLTDIRMAMIEVIQEDCINWDRHTDTSGYGRTSNGSLAHRKAYVAAYGAIPEGLEIDHICFNRACVNPDHLEAVTHAENMRRARRPACGRGHDFTDENTYWYRGVRRCRACNVIHQRTYKERKRTIS